MNTEDLIRRVESLERRQRRMRRLSLSAVLLVVGCVAMGQATTGDTSEVLKTKNLQIVDGAGTSRIVLAVEEGGPSGLVINDAAGKPRAMVGLTPDGSPVVRLSDTDGRLRASLLVASDAEPALELYDGSGQVRLRAVTFHGQPGLALIDRAGEERIEIASLDGGENGLALNGAGGVLQGAFGTAELLRMLTDEARPRGAAGVVLCDPAGRVMPPKPGEDF